MNPSLANQPTWVAQHVVPISPAKMIDTRGSEAFVAFLMMYPSVGVAPVVRHTGAVTTPRTRTALIVNGPSSGNGSAASAVVLIHDPFVYGPGMNRPPAYRAPILGPVTKPPRLPQQNLQRFRKAGPARRRMLRRPRRPSLTRREGVPIGNSALAAHGAMQVPENRPLTGLALTWGPLFVRSECQLRQGPAGCFASFICGGGTPLPTKWTESFGLLGSPMRSFDLFLLSWTRAEYAVNGNGWVPTA